MRHALAIAAGLSLLAAAPHVAPASPGDLSMDRRGPAGPIQPEDGAPPIDPARLSRLDEVIREAIDDRQLPGAVVLVGHPGGALYHKAFGNRSVEPAVEPMTPETIFDLASLTKPVATATSVMLLVEEGRVRLTDRVAAFIPGFERYGKGDITVRHLLTHVSGLRPDLDLEEAFSGYEEGIRRAIEEVPLAPPDERFVYSDINFFLLGHIVSRVSGMSLEKFARARIFEPLGMRDTMFMPPPALSPRIAPTERCLPLAWPCGSTEAPMLRGVVHDPTARRMGGVAGHAGLFGTAADLALYCRMLLGGGALGSTRILAPLTVAKMTSPATPHGMRQVRGLGWDIDSTFAVNRGELLPIGSFGHTGFTGTSIWIDPTTGLFVIFLSNRVHPDGKGDVTALRAKVSTIAAAALTRISPGPLLAAPMTSTNLAPAGEIAKPVHTPVLTGIDVLRSEGFARLRGRRVGLVTNHTGRARDGSTTIDLLHAAPDVKLVALFSPEHGIRGVLDAKVPSSTDEKTGLPIHSLYGETRRPTPAMLQGIDVMVIDLQDIGARFYTYMTTMAYVMEEAAKQRIAVMVLDRPNPIDGYDVEGPTLDEDAPREFISYFPMTVRHGLTLGELARLFKVENDIAADLTVVAMQHWRRDAWFDETGLPWVNPSPNMRNMNQATLYPGVGAIEYTNVSVGRGTDSPFEQIGAPWIDGVRLASELNARGLAGIRFYPIAFTPASSKHAGEACQGVFMIVTDRRRLRPVRLGLEIAAALQRLHGAHFQVAAAQKLLGSKQALARLIAGDDPADIAASWASDEAKWRLLRAPYLLYR